MITLLLLLLADGPITALPGAMQWQASYPYYVVERTTNFQAWTVAAEVLPSNGLCRVPVEAPGFYRYRVALCPPAARAFGCALSVLTTDATNGQPCAIRLQLIYLPTDPASGAAFASWCGGVLSFQVSGQDFTLTNTIPTLGPASCGGRTTFTAQHIITAPAQDFVVLARYRGGLTGYAEVTGSALRKVKVITP